MRHVPQKYQTPAGRATADLPILADDAALLSAALDLLHAPSDRGRATIGRFCIPENDGLSQLPRWKVMRSPCTAIADRILPVMRLIF